MYLLIYSTSFVRSSIRTDWVHKYKIGDMTTKNLTHGVSGTHCTPPNHTHRQIVVPRGPRDRDEVGPVETKTNTICNPKTDSKVNFFSRKKIFHK